MCYYKLILMLYVWTLPLLCNTGLIKAVWPTFAKNKQIQFDFKDGIVLDTTTIFFDVHCDFKVTI